MPRQDAETEYRLAIDHYVAILYDLQQTQTELGTLQRRTPKPVAKLEALRRRVNMLSKLLLATQRVAARKEEALGLANES